jgi:hypothetical protein
MGNLSCQNNQEILKVARSYRGDIRLCSSILVDRKLKIIGRHIECFLFDICWIRTCFLREEYKPREKQGQGENRGKQDVFKCEWGK